MLLHIIDQDCVGCMSPQKLLFCYHLPTRGRAGVKLGDAWYVSNVSIIFYAPCLFYTNCPMFYLCFGTLFMHFPELTYWQVATVPVPCFLLFLCFRKVTQEIFSELDNSKAEVPIFFRHVHGVQSRDGGGRRGGHTTPRRRPTPGQA